MKDAYKILWFCECYSNIKKNSTKRSNCKLLKMGTIIPRFSLIPRLSTNLFNKSNNSNRSENNSLVFQLVLPHNLIGRERLSLALHEPHHELLREAHVRPLLDTRPALHKHLETSQCGGGDDGVCALGPDGVLGVGYTRLVPLPSSPHELRIQLAKG